MTARHIVAAAALVFAAILPAAGPARADGSPSAGIVGVWETPEKSEVTVAPCPEDFCGSLTKIVVPPEELAKLTPDQRAAVAKMDPSQFPDARNKDPNLRTRTLLGLALFVLHPSDDPAKFNGQMYNPQDGNTYDGYMQVVDANTIKVGGCVLKILCRDQEWTRAPAPVAGAETTGAAPGAAGAAPTAAGAAPAADPGGF